MDRIVILSKLNVVKVAPSVFDNQRIIVRTHLERSMIQIPEVDASARFLINSRCHRNPVTRHDLPAFIQPSSVSDVGQVRGDTQVLSKLLRNT